MPDSNIDVSAVKNTTVMLVSAATGVGRAQQSQANALHQGVETTAADAGAEVQKAGTFFGFTSRLWRTVGARPECSDVRLLPALFSVGIHI